MQWILGNLQRNGWQAVTGLLILLLLLRMRVRSRCCSENKLYADFLALLKAPAGNACTYCRPAVVPLHPLPRNLWTSYKKRLLTSPEPYKSTTRL